MRGAVRLGRVAAIDEVARQRDLAAQVRVRGRHAAVDHRDAHAATGRDRMQFRQVPGGGRRLRRRERIAARAVQQPEDLHRLGRHSTRTHVDARPPPWLGWALAGQAALLAAFAVALWQRPEPPAPYRLLGTSASAGDLIVVFDPRVDEATLRGLLRASGTRIVDGPNEAGAYVLAVPPARMASVRAALRAAPGVRLVESLAPESGAPAP